VEFFKKKTSIEFMRRRALWYGISALLLVSSCVLVAVRGLNFGIDFTGGVVLELAFAEAPDLQQIRSSLAAAGHGEATAQTIGNDREIMVRLIAKPGADVNRVGEEVLAAMRNVDSEVELRRTEVVGAQIGRELAEQGALAALVTFLGILAYVAMRFQWKLGVGSIFAAMHDPVVVLGFFAATQITFDLPALAAILAVVGYSLNDTVVVFDRIRERFVTTRRTSPSDTIDLAINDTLPRTLMTSITTMIAAGSLLLFGGEVLRGFSVALVIGVLVGTYSSIYIAAAIALDLKLSARDLLPQQKERGPVDDMP
jgi:preprotein translocase subunit SecF